jgi:serine phosphatase RsbU (regulator of sigma subunit)
LTYLNAGAVAPLLIRRGGEGAQVLRLPPTAPPMVSGSSEPVHTADLVLETGDLLSAFNPGLVEAFNAASEPWGEGRLIQTLLAWETQRAADLVSLTLRTVEEHTAHQLSSPDRAMILLKAV